MPEKCPIYSFSPLKDESIRIRHLVGEDNQFTENFNVFAKEILCCDIFSRTISSTLLKFVKLNRQLCSNQVSIMIKFEIVSRSNTFDRLQLHSGSCPSVLTWRMYHHRKKNILLRDTIFPTHKTTVRCYQKRSHRIVIIYSGSHRRRAKNKIMTVHSI